MGSYYDFIAHYGREIEDNLKRFKKLAAQIEQETAGQPDEVYVAKIDSYMKHIDGIYDKPVAGLIDRLLAGDSYIDVKEIADVALDINNRYGTDMRQVVNAMDDVLGPVHDIDEKEMSRKEYRKHVEGDDPTGAPSQAIRSEKCKICGKPSDPQWSAEDGEYCSQECLMTYSDKDEEKEELVEVVEEKSIHDLYDILNNLDGATYVESEGQNCIRVDFDNGGSIWFDEYPGDKSIRGNAGQYNSQVKQVAKKYGFVIGRLEEQINEEHFKKFNEKILEDFKLKIQKLTGN